MLETKVPYVTAVRVGLAEHSAARYSSAPMENYALLLRVTVTRFGG